MNNKILFGFGALFLISILSLGVIAYQGNINVKGPNYSTEVHERLEAAIEAGDYDAWLKIRQDNNLPTRGKIFQVINKDNFDKFAELHEANEEGDADKADAIRAELGLGQGMMKRGSGKGQGKMMGPGNSQRMQQFIDTDNDGVCDNYAVRN